MSEALDYIAAVCTIVGTVFTLITLLTVYLAAVQLVTQRRIYRLGLSNKSLGPWTKTVSSYSPLKFMQREISTPRVSLPLLVEKNRTGKWQPCITFPTGFRGNSRSCWKSSDEEQGLIGDQASNQVLAETSWVNFLEALSINPGDKNLYEMRFESELVNGIVPMRWKGKDLVGICCVLGFQSYEKEPSYKNPMPLPMQWSGPLGYLQFRGSSEGCVAEFRRRVALEPQLSKDVFSYFKRHKIPSRPLRLEVRLWQSINGLYLMGNRTLYIGGQNKSSDRRRSKKLKAIRGQSNDSKVELPENRSAHNISEDSGIQDTSSDGNWVPEKVELLSKCPGLLSTILEGELAHGWGLNFTSGCSQYCRVYSDFGDWERFDKSTYPYRLGTLCMDKELLKLVREAAIELQPDGYYFTPTSHLYNDVFEFYRHVGQLSNDLFNGEPDDWEMHSDNLNHIIFPKSTVEEWSAHGPQWVTLHHAMELCNDFQRLKHTAKAQLTIEDMRIVSKATECLRDILGPDGIDLFWAFIMSPKLFFAMFKRYSQMNVEKVVNFVVKSSDSEIVYLEPEAPYEEFEVPLMRKADFSSRQVLAALVNVFLTYFWVNEKWIADVRCYDPTIPQSVTMC